MKRAVFAARRTGLWPIAVLALASCADNQIESPIEPSPGTISSPEWSIMTTSREMTAICELGGDVLALSNGGAILRGDKDGWTGDLTRFQYMSDVWPSPDGQAFAVGGGTVTRYDGARWTWKEILGGNLWGVWGTSSTDVFAVGDVNRTGFIGDSVS
jgi:hypothetical protein